ncbi:MAG TPA: ABC transporter permease [Thermoleophilaceae bacterium]|nr:ABC transporter permease [Thermoleophilaceae bacterium]
MTSESVAVPPVTPRVHVPAGGVRAELRAIKIVWHREWLRFLRDRPRIAAAFVQPMLFLFVLGTGLSRIASAGTHGVNLRTFVYPGVLAMSVLFTAIFSAASVVWDREFGFLREMLVAPVSRGSIVVGKCLGGASVAAFQGLLVIMLAGLVDVPYSPVMIVEVFAMQVLLAFTLTAFGVMLAVRIKQIQSFMAITQMLLMPMFFISGALFPVAGLPVWLTILNRVDPVTYAVDPIRHTVFAHLQISDAARHALNPGVTWGSWHLPVLFEVAIVAAIGFAMLGVATALFSRDG